MRSRRFVLETRIFFIPWCFLERSILNHVYRNVLDSNNLSSIDIAFTLGRI